VIGSIFRKQIDHANGMLRYEEVETVWSFAKDDWVRSGLLTLFEMKGIAYVITQVVEGDFQLSFLISYFFLILYPLRTQCNIEFI
jgi:hypothetical protein